MFQGDRNDSLSLHSLSFVIDGDEKKGEAPKMRIKIQFLCWDGGKFRNLTVLYFLNIFRGSRSRN